MSIIPARLLTPRELSCLGNNIMPAVDPDSGGDLGGDLGGDSGGDSGGGDCDGDDSALAAANRSLGALGEDVHWFDDSDPTPSHNWTPLN